MYYSYAHEYFLLTSEDVATCRTFQRGSVLRTSPIAIWTARNSARLVCCPLLDLAHYCCGDYWGLGTIATTFTYVYVYSFRVPTTSFSRQKTGSLSKSTVSSAASNEKQLSFLKACFHIWCFFCWKSSYGRKERRRDGMKEAILYLEASVATAARADRDILFLESVMFYLYIDSAA